MKTASPAFSLIVISVVASASAQVPPPDVDPLIPAAYQSRGEIGADVLLAGSRSERTIALETIVEPGLAVGGLGVDPRPISPEVPPELQDPAFASYVDIAQVIAAIRDGEPERLVDQVGQLIEGERILFRPHKALSAKRALELCLSIVKSQDHVARLKTLVQQSKREDLAQVMESADATQKLSGESRSARIAFTISELTPERLNFLKEMASAIDSAGRLQDAAGLSELESTVRELPILAAKEREYLTELISTARASEVAGDGEHDALLKLVASSRPPSTQDEAIRRLLLEFVLRLLLELALNNQATLNQSQSAGIGSGSGIPQPIIPTNTGNTSGSGGNNSGGLNLIGGLRQCNAQPASSIGGQWNSPFGTIWLQQDGYLVTGNGQYYQGGNLSLSGQYSQGALILNFQHQTDPSIRGVVTFIVSLDQSRLDGVFKNTVSGRSGNWVLER